MKNLYLRIYILLALLFASSQAYSQCAAPIIAVPDTNYCGNRTVSFSIGTLTATTFDFTSSLIPAGWISSPYVIGQPCWTYMVDSSSYYWATLLSSGVRFVQTQSLDVSAGGNIQFYMRYGADDPDPGCEDPDLVVEGVFLQFSTNGGTTWNNIQSWTPRSDKTGPLYVWTNYTIPIPLAAQTTNTTFRWFQPQNSGVQWDNWGLDDIFIQAVIGGVNSILWNFGDGTTSTLPSPVKTYAAPGDYNVSLAISTTSSCFGTTNTVVSLRNDTTPPVAVARNVTRSLAGNGTIVITPNDVDNGSSDNCRIVSRTVSPNTFNCTNIGGNLVTLTVTDSANNVSTTTSLVTIVDSVPPTIIARVNLPTFNLDASGARVIAVSEIDSASFDACGIFSRQLIPNRVTCADIGQRTITLRVTDIYGNSRDSSITITVGDSILPRARAQSDTLYLGSNGTVTAVPANFNTTSTDNCPITFSLSNTEFNCNQLGVNPVLFTATDPSGNFSTANIDIIILDTIKPTLGLQPVDLFLDVNGIATLSIAMVDTGSFDNCTIVSRLLSKTTFNCANQGLNRVVFTATDQSGNFTRDTIDVMVYDNRPPDIYARNINAYLSEFGDVFITAQDVDSATFDNCKLDNISIDLDYFTCSNLGDNFITFTALDSVGNLSTASVTVTVLDTLNPHVFANDVTIVLDSMGLGLILVDSVDAGSFDNCGIDSMWIDNPMINCTELGGTFRYLLARDFGGNIDSAFFSVFVLDTIAPTVRTRNAVVFLNDAGIANVTSDLVDSFSTDNCVIDSMWVLPSQFNCADTGQKVVSLYVRDSEGNTAFATATVEVRDTIAPTVFVTDTVVYLDITGNVNFTPALINNGTFDNCGLDTLLIDVADFSCNDKGVKLVTLTAIDLSGNTASKTASVNVRDTIAPFLSLKTLTAYLDTSGTFTLSPSLLVDSVYDNCGVQNAVVNPPLANCDMRGISSVSVTATDSSGNATSASILITVLDTITPNVLTQNITVYLDATGNVNINPAMVNNGSSDNCAIETLTVSPNAFDCSNRGANTVTLTVTDSSGNTSSATATVTVLDTIAPTVLTQNITVYLDATGNVNITPAMVNNGSSDNCAIETLAVSPNTFDCSNRGANTVTLTVTDSSGNTSSVIATVTVLDTIAPNVLTQNITVYLDATGNVNITPAMVNNGSSDNCAIENLTVSPNTFDCTNRGANTVTLTVTDSSGNTSSATATVTVLDTIAPNVLTQNITVYLGATGNVNITPAMVSNGSSDNCAIETLTVSPNTFDCTNRGANTVTLTVTDSSGNTSNATATVTVLDTIAPTVLTQNITVYLDATGNVNITPAMVNNGSSDNCAIETLTVSPNTFDCSNRGANTVTLTVADSSGNTSSATATVTVLDTTAPTVLTQNITVYLDATGNVNINPAMVNNGSSDNCAIETLAVSPNTFDCSNRGANTVTLTVTDSSGNTSSVIATVTVLDTIAPNVLTQNITVYLDATGNINITPAMVNNGSSDNCAIESFSVLPASFDCSNLGPNVVTLTLTDSSGNTNFATATVLVRDTIKPFVNAEPRTVYVDSTGTYTNMPSFYDVGSIDNCGIARMWVVPEVFNCSNLGTNILTLFVEDIDGNIHFDTALVQVFDTLPPIVRSNDITIYLDTTGKASITGFDIDDGSLDYCNIASSSISKSDFTCNDIGDNIVVLSITDIWNNTGTANATVTVLDTVSPRVFPRVVNLYLGANGSATLLANDADSASWDNCKIVSKQVSQTVFDCSHIGPNQVVLSVTDSVGNIGTALTTVWVIDTVRSVVIPRNIVVYVDTLGMVSITASQVDSASYDSCGIQTRTVWPNTFDCSNKGINTVVLTVTDVNGNIDSAIATVTVVDTIVPLVRTQDITVYLDTNGRISITPQQVDAGSTDNCFISILEVVPDTFTCTNLGANVVTLFVTDSSGNIASKVATVTVIDSIRPLPVARPLVVYLDALGQANITATMADSASTDNCSISNRTVYPFNFDCSNIGTNTSYLKVVDQSGNEDSVSFTLTIIDTVRPVVLPRNIVVYVDTLGTVSITASQVDSASADACGIQTRTVWPNTFYCSNKGINTVVLTVTDVNGNIDSAIATVTVVDTIVPLVRTQDIIVYLDTNGRVSITPQQIDAGSTDNCFINMLEVVPDTFTCANLGANQVTLFVTDSSGNVGSKVATVTVIDSIRPLPVARPLVVYLDALGQANITAAMADSASTDNCSITNRTVYPFNFDCSNIGINTSYLKVVDQSGNEDSVSCTVTVIDTVRPVVVPRNIVVYIDTLGTVSITASQVDSASADICGIQTRTVWPNTFDCSNKGINTVVLTVTDVNGNIDSAIATVTVVDTIVPLVRTQDIIVYLDTNGRVSITPQQVDAGSTDNCFISILEVVSDTFTCANLGANQVTLFVTDSSGNVASKVATVTVVDSIRPLPVARPLVVYLDALGQANITAAMADSASTDNCSITNRTVYPFNFDCSNIGTNTSYLKVVDQSGNEDSVSFTVTIIDTVRPVVLPRNIVVYVDTLGTVSITASQVDSASADICGIQTRTVWPNTFDCSNKGINTVVLTITDVNGNIDSAIATVSVVDTIAPMAIGQPISIYLNSMGVAAPDASLLNNGSSDNCSSLVFEAEPNLFGCDDVGTNQVVFSVSDLSGNRSFDTVVVTVLDTLKPIAVPRTELIVYLNDSGFVAITGAMLDSASFDPCGSLVYAATPASFNCSNLGLNNVQFTVTDRYGNISTGNVMVEVKDTTAPKLNLKNITAYLASDGTCSIRATDIDNGTTDNCTLDTMLLSKYDFTCNEIGSNTVLVSGIDQSGNVAQQQVTVMLLDTIKPVVVTRKVDLYLNASGGAVLQPWMVDINSTDNCAITNRTLSKSVFVCTDLGTQIVQLSITDTSGNMQTASAAIQVIDTIKPIPSYKQVVTLFLNQAGTASLNPFMCDSNTTDNCTVSNFVASKTQFSCGDIGMQRIWVSAIDQSGNSRGDSVNVMVLDTIRPIPVCRPAVTLYVHKDSCGVTHTIIPPSSDSIDNCSATFTADVASTQFYPRGTTTITWTATDPSGNTNVCTQLLHVLDTIRPVVRPRRLFAFLNAAGSVEITPQTADSATTDNCGLDSLYLSRSSFACADVGNHTVRLFARDVNGNIGSATFLLTVRDTIKPSIFDRDVTVYLNAAGTVSLTPQFVDNGTFDACGVANLSLSKTTFNCADVGDNAVVFTARDVNGNDTSITVQVRVFDTIAPVVRTKDIQVVLGADNTITIVPQDVNNNSTDPCGIDSMWVIPNRFDITNLRNNLVLLYVRDVNGNVSFDTAFVYVIERNPPVAVCRNISVTLQDGRAEITPAMVDGGSTDETGIMSMQISRSVFNCTHIGSNRVILTITDSTNLSSTCEAIVEVIGEIPVFGVKGEIDREGAFIGQRNITTDSNQIFLGYGPQSFKLYTIPTSSDTPFTYNWSGVGIFDSSLQNPIVFPTRGGTLKYTSEVTNKYGCKATQEVEVCVIDVRDPRVEPGAESRVLVCKAPLKNMRHPSTVSMSVGEVAFRMLEGDKLGHCDSRCGGPDPSALIGNKLMYEAIVFPNPSNYTFNMRFVTPTMEGTVNIKVHDINGRMVYEQENVDVLGVTSFGEDFKTGVYFIEVIGAGLNYRIKAVKVN